MSHFRFRGVLPATACWMAFSSVSAVAQTPTYAPSSPLVAPGEPMSGSDSSTIPQSTIPQNTVPESTIPSTTLPPITVPSTIPNGGSTIPGGSLPSGNTFDPPATIVTPGTVPAARRGWYPGYWLGFRPYDPPYGGGPVPYRTNYQGFAAPYGAPGGCNTCQPAVPVAPAPCAACGSQNLDFGRGYDGFMTGW